MKLKFLFTLLVLCSTIVNAELITLVTPSQEYLSRETVQLEIILENPEVQPTAANIKFLDKENNSIRIAPLFNKIETNHYYAYFDLPELDEGDYRIQLSGLKFKVNNILKEISKEIPIKVTKGTPILNLKPGFFVLENKPKELELQLITKGEKVDVKFETHNSIKHPYMQEESIIKDSSRKFFFQFTPIEEIYNTKIYINLTYANESYSIPVFVIIGVERIEAKEAFEFITEVERISKTLDKTQEVSGSLGIKNILNETMNNIKFEISEGLNEIVELDIIALEVFQPSEIVNLLFIINKNKKPSKLTYSGEFKVSSGSYSRSMPIEIRFNEEIPVLNKTEEPIKQEVEQTEFELFKLPPPVPVERRPESKLGLYLVIVITLLFAYLIYKLTRKQKQKKTFKEYITKMKS